MMRVSAGIVRYPDGRILICRRGEGRKNAHLWEFPGGLLHSASPLGNEFGSVSVLLRTGQQLSENEGLERTILRRRVYGVFC